VPTDLLHSILSNVWSIFLVVLFFGGSIFVHELGHFLAARRRGVIVERFSIGFGPAIFGWRGRDGVKYQLSWFPLGGYVLLPQLADLGAIEGESAADAAKLPPIDYASKMIVFLAGATFNVLFAFALACIIWIAGQPEADELAHTLIGGVSPTLELVEGGRTVTVTSPAAAAGLQVGDEVRAIDGRPVTNWTDLTQTVIAGSGRGENGEPRSVFTIVRDGRTREVVLYPKISGDDQMRRVGISPGYALIVHRIVPHSAADKAGLKPGDRLLTCNGLPELNVGAFAEALGTAPGHPAALKVERSGQTLTLTLPPREGRNENAGIEFLFAVHLIHPSPFAQVADQVGMTFRTLWALINPRSDIGLSKMSGPVGIVHIFHEAAEAGLRPIILFTILVNVNLAIFNLLPIPVLDGGQMLFATIGRLRGRSLPVNFVMATQTGFAVLILGVMLYLSGFDVMRWYREGQPSKAAAPAAPAAAAEPPASAPGAVQP
jgi:regulator of sigma E protease